MTMLGWVLVLLIGRLIGWPILAVWWLAGWLWQEQTEGKWGQLIGMGILADLAVGTRFGITSLLFWLMALEVMVYKEKVGPLTGWSMMMWALLTTAQAGLFWHHQPGGWGYILAIPICSGFNWWFSRRQLSGRGKGIYLRGTN
jgi:hypothetical protein